MSQVGRQGLGILLSHHSEDQLHLCVRLECLGRALYLCARCLGLYPGLALVLVAGGLTGPWPWWLEWGLLFLAPLPALIDWGTATGAGRPERANWIRLLTGFGLGVGIGANLQVNTRDLLGVSVRAQLVFFLAYLWIVWVFSYVRRFCARRQALKRLRTKIPRPGGPDPPRRPGPKEKPSAV